MQKHLSDKVWPPDFRPELVLMACFDGTLLLYLVIIVIVYSGNTLPGGALTAVVSVANRNDRIRNIWCHSAFFLFAVTRVPIAGLRSPAQDQISLLQCVSPSTCRSLFYDCIVITIVFHPHKITLRSALMRFYHNRGSFFFLSQNLTNRHKTRRKFKSRLVFTSA